MIIFLLRSILAAVQNFPGPGHRPTSQKQRDAEEILYGKSLNHEGTSQYKKGIGKLRGRVLKLRSAKSAEFSWTDVKS